MRYKWLTIALVIVGGILGGIATRFVAPVYEARAKLWVLSNNPTKAPAGPIRAEELLPQNSWVELFQAFAITDSVVAKRGLAATPPTRRTVRSSCDSPRPSGRSSATTASPSMRRDSTTS